MNKKKVLLISIIGLAVTPAHNVMIRFGIFLSCRSCHILSH
jgi:uncharacterized membrane protein